MQKAVGVITAMLMMIFSDLHHLWLNHTHILLFACMHPHCVSFLQVNFPDVEKVEWLNKVKPFHHTTLHRYAAYSSFIKLTVNTRLSVK